MREGAGTREREGEGEEECERERGGVHATSIFLLVPLNILRAESVQDWSVGVNN